MDGVEILKAVASMISSLAVVGGLLVAALKPLRKKFAKWMTDASGVSMCNAEIDKLVGAVSDMQRSLDSHIKQSDSERKETLKAIAEINSKLDATNKKLADTVETQRNDARNIITDIWYKYGKHGEIPRYKYDLFLKTYADYKEHLHGNSFVDDIHAKMADIKIVD